MKLDKFDAIFNRRTYDIDMELFESLSIETRTMHRDVVFMLEKYPIFDNLCEIVLMEKDDETF